MSLRVARRAVVSGAAAALAMPGWAQQTGPIHRLGFVVQPARRDFDAMFDELRRHGFVEGEHLRVDPPGFGVSAVRLNAAAAEAVRAAPDAIYAGGSPAGHAVQRLTSTIPLVVAAYDMVQAHLVASLAHPGGNITGISILATELDGKRLGILIETLPGVRHVAALADPDTATSDQIDRLVEEARSRGIELSVHRAATAAGIRPAIEAARAGGAQALSVLASAMFQANRALVIEQVAKSRLPTMYQWPEWGREGALLCYGPRINSFYRQAARQIAKIFTGIKPRDIPVEQPDKIELTVNLKTANLLGLTIPPLILARADEIIQ